MQNTLIVAIRLLALYVMIMALSILPNYLSMFSVNLNDEPIARATVIAGLVSIAWDFIIGAVLWVFSFSIASLITKDLYNAQSNDTVEFSMENIQIVSISLIGLYILSSAIPTLFELLISYKFPEMNPRYTRTIDVMGKMKAEIPVIDLAKIIVKLSLGFWFLLGTNGIVNAIRKFWAKGKSI